MTISRRTFIFTGAFGIAALVAVRYLPRTPAQAPLRSLTSDGQAIMSAIVPVMLAGALPDDPSQRHEAIRETVVNIDQAISGLSPLQIREIGQLFTLLALAPVRWSLTFSMRAWDESTANDVDAFLSRLRDSRIALLRAAYDALHQLVFAAWYGNPRAWAAIGYDGPPAIT
ncbi:MAG TPA: hypothetical protein VGL25_19740 [Casimicrobiaceae bacterium]